MYESVRRSGAYMHILCVCVCVCVFVCVCKCMCVCVCLRVCGAMANSVLAPAYVCAHVGM